MAKNAQGEEIVVPTPELNEDGTPKTPIEGDKGGDAEFEKELRELESGQQAPKPQRTELEKATFTAKSTLKRIKELGGDPTALLGETPPVEKPIETDTSQFVTKTDLARQEAQKLARSPGEVKLIMWWVENKGMSVQDAHYMANKGRILKTVGEITRAKDAVPSNDGGGPGQVTPINKDDAPILPELDRQRLVQSGMTYDPSKKAWIGKKIQQRWDSQSKSWVTERIPQK